jgi:hypothetical protein
MTLKLTNRSAIIAGSPTMLIVVGPERHYVLTPINLLTLNLPTSDARMSQAMTRQPL